MAAIRCQKCDASKEGFARSPFPGAIGARVLEGTCPDCWQLWLKQQTMLINHYCLNVMDPTARQFLTRNMDAFLFRGGQLDEVDTSKQGTIAH